MNQEVKILYIIGGGSSNQLLNQFTANSLNIPINAGPVEATAIGNVLMQAKAVGLVDNIQELRQCVIQSFPSKDYLPEDIKSWRNAYKDYLRITT